MHAPHPVEGVRLCYPTTARLSVFAFIYLCFVIGTKINITAIITQQNPVFYCTSVVWRSTRPFS